MCLFFVLPKQSAARRSTSGLHATICSAASCQYGHQAHPSPKSSSLTHAPLFPTPPTPRLPTTLKTIINSGFCGNRRLRYRKRILAGILKFDVKYKIILKIHYFKNLYITCYDVENYFGITQIYL